MNSSSINRGAAASWLNWLLVLAPLGCLWYRLISNLSVEWNTNPQYSYGWVVPFLCVAFLLQRRQSLRNIENRTGSTDPGFAPPTSIGWQMLLLWAAMAFLYLPIRLIEEATPEWRPIQWTLGLEAIGLTLCAIYLAKGRRWLWAMAFPICFFLVAIPWLTPIEQPLVQFLTRINSSITVELLGLLGIPAMQHGNLIEVSTGTVGVSEACSGIRSFQTSLMVSLFFGEFYDFSAWRRVLFVPIGFILAMAFNVCRMSFLTIIAARKGILAIGQYHDPAGVMIAVVCTAALWGVASLLKRMEQKRRGTYSPPAGKPKGATVAPQSALTVPVASRQKSYLLAFSYIFLGWLIFVESGVELWYRGLESNLKPSPKWSVQLPTDNPTFQNLPINADTENLLRYDDGVQGTWIDSEGARWQSFYFNWQPGKVAGYLAKRHTPEICLPAAGCNLISGPVLAMTNINGVALPLRSYVFTSDGDPMYVFHCRWEAGASPEAYVEHESARLNLIRGIWSGRGKDGQKILEMIVTGYASPDLAKAALIRQLQTMVKVEQTPANPVVATLQHDALSIP